MSIYEIGQAVPKYIGASTDTKPTATSTQGMRAPHIGSTFLEYDTGDLYITYDGTNWELKSKITGDMTEVRVSKVINASDGAYAAGDVVNDDNCGTTADPWEFTVAKANGRLVTIHNAVLINETENQAVQYDLYLFNATPTGEKGDNIASTNPIKADRAKYLSVIEFPQSIARGATVATHTQATPSTTGGLPLLVKCASADTKIYGVLVTRTAYTQTATDDIEISLTIEQH